MGFLLVLCFWLLLMVAEWSIITKAGYSGWWISAPLSLIVLWVTAFLVARHALLTMRTINLNAELDASAALGVLIVLDGILNFVLFLVFAFSDWPVLRTGPARPRYSEPPGAPGPGGTPPAPPPPMTGKAPGWYQVGATNNDQAYWDGTTWTARRHWAGAGWSDVPLTPADPAS